MGTSSIGSTGAYGTIALWEAAIPDGSTAFTEDYIGQLQNETHDIGTGVVTFSDRTAMGSYRIRLECQTGASFKDNANVRTNALRYNASNGAAITGSYNYGGPFAIVCPNFGMRGVQIYASGTNNCVALGASSATADNGLYEDCIFESEGVAANNAVVRVYGSGVKIVNCLIVNRGTGNQGAEPGNGARMINCTVVRPSNITAAGDGIGYFYGTPRIDNCAIFGFATPVESSGSFSGSSTDNATDQASGLPGTGQVYSVTYSSTSPFTNADEGSGTHDFRLADDGNGLIDAGTKDATNAPNDISGTVRAAGCEIGVWELAAAAAGHPAMRRLGLVEHGRPVELGRAGVRVF